MNILHIEDEPWDSGMAHYALTLAAEQARRGHRVEFWGRDGSPVLDAARGLGLLARGWPGGAAGCLSWFAQRRQAAAFSPRVINAHTGTAQSLALLLAAGLPCAVVRTRGDARPARASPWTSLAASRTAAFIAANGALEQSLKAAFPAALIERVAQGLAGPARAEPLPGAPLIGMIARFDPVKGHAILLGALRRLAPRFPDLRAICAGEGRLLADARRRLTSAGLEQVVELPGRVPDVWSFMAACRVGVVASLGSEAVSRAALEWMAAGRPVVASRVGGLGDLVEDGVSGLLVEPGDENALAQALSRLLLDPALAETMGRAGRRRWEEAFSPETFYQATQRVYDAATRDLPS